MFSQFTRIDILAFACLVTLARLIIIYRLVYSAYSCEPVLGFGEHDILSSEGAQQGDPLGSLEFCEAIHPLLMSLDSHVKIGFMDDVTLSGELPTVERDIIIHAEHVVQSAWILFSLWMYVCMFVC